MADVARSSVLRELIEDVTAYGSLVETDKFGDEFATLEYIGPGTVAGKSEFVAMTDYSPDGDNEKLAELKSCMTFVRGNDDITMSMSSIQWLAGLMYADLMDTVQTDKNTQYRSLLVALPLLWFHDNDGTRFVISSIGSALDIVRGKMMVNKNLPSNASPEPVPDLEKGSVVKGLAALHYLVLVMHAYALKNTNDVGSDTLKNLKTILDKMAQRRLVSAMKKYADKSRYIGTGLEDNRLLARAYARSVNEGVIDEKGETKKLYEFVFEKALYPIFKMPAV